MGYSADRARMEAQLAVAHRALYRAMQAAEDAGDEGASEDLAQLLREVSRVADLSLRGKPRRAQLKGQLEISA